MGSGNRRGGTELGNSVPEYNTLAIIKSIAIFSLSLGPGIVSLEPIDYCTTIREQMELQHLQIAKSSEIQSSDLMKHILMCVGNLLLIGTSFLLLNSLSGGLSAYGCSSDQSRLLTLISCSVPVTGRHAPDIEFYHHVYPLWFQPSSSAFTQRR